MARARRCGQRRRPPILRDARWHKHPWSVRTGGVWGAADLPGCPWEAFPECAFFVVPARHPSRSHPPHPPVKWGWRWWARSSHARLGGLFFALFVSWIDRRTCRDCGLIGARGEGGRRSRWAGFLRRPRRAVQLDPTPSRVRGAGGAAPPRDSDFACNMVRPARGDRRSGPATREPQTPPPGAQRRQADPCCGVGPRARQSVSPTAGSRPKDPPTGLPSTP